MSKDPASDWLYGKRRKASELSDTDRQIAAELDQLLIEDLHEAYTRTGNGAHAWTAWSIAREHEIDPPEWVLEFIDQCAKSLAQADSTAAAATAVGFLHHKGGDSHGNAHSDDQRAAQDLVLAYQAEMLRFKSDRPGSAQTKTEVYKRLAKRFNTTPAAIQSKIRRLS